MKDGKLFKAQSTIVVSPKKSMHNWTYTCEVWNEAQIHARHARARIEVKYPPSVTVAPLKPVVPKEGEKVKERTEWNYGKRSTRCVPTRKGDGKKKEWLVSFRLFCQVGFQCMASANPPPYADKYQWYLDDRPLPGQFGFYFEISNVTRAYQNRQLKCSVQNLLGKADGVRTIEVQCEEEQNWHFFVAQVVSPSFFSF